MPAAPAGPAGPVCWRPWRRGSRPRRHRRRRGRGPGRPGLPGRRGTGHGRLAGAAPAAAAVPRGRRRGGQDRGRQGAEPRWTGGRLVRLQCYEGIDASQALYEWDHARQLLHLRAAEAAGRASAAGVEALEDELYAERFLVRRPLLQALDGAGDGSRPRCCSSTRSTAPTTSSRRSCSSCCPTGR